jgi:hypothetical protein
MHTTKWMSQAEARWTQSLAAGTWQITVIPLLHQQAS